MECIPIHGKQNGVAPHISNFDPKHHACEFLNAELLTETLDTYWLNVACEGEL